MKILLCHNFYQNPGGEDTVFANEGELLERHGHHVIRYCRSNHDIDNMSRLDIAGKTIWNMDTVRALGDLIKSERPDVMHCHNVFPLISPSAYSVAKRHHVAVVQTLHNYRLLCPNAQFFRNGRVCEDCSTSVFPWPAVMHRCYREKWSASALVAAMLAFHNAGKTWSTAIDRYIALTEFSKRKFVEGGLPAKKISVKPNFVLHSPKKGDGSGHYAIFAGRLSEEKGVRILLEAWQSLSIDLELRILGDGPLMEAVNSAAGADLRIKPYGHRPQEEVHSMIGGAQFLIMPSIWYETFGLGLIDAYARGTPVIASRLGVMPEIIRENETGFCFEPGRPKDLANVVTNAVENPDLLRRMRVFALAEYKNKYNSKHNYQFTMNIYNHAIEDSRL